MSESIGIATGFLLMALHCLGFVALTHTLSPMNFISKVLERPENEKAYLLIPVRYTAETAKVLALKRKDGEQVIELYR